LWLTRMKLSPAPTFVEAERDGSPLLMRPSEAAPGALPSPPPPPGCCISPGLESISCEPLCDSLACPLPPCLAGQGRGDR
jgi:hypothetical protein